MAITFFGGFGPSLPDGSDFRLNGAFGPLTPEEESDGINFANLAVFVEIGFCLMCGGPLETLEDTEDKLSVRCRTCGASFMFAPLRGS